MSIRPIRRLVKAKPTLEGADIIKYAVQRLKQHNAKGIPHLLTLANIVLTPTTPQATLNKYVYTAS